MGPTLLHIGGASTASVIISLVAIFLLMLIMSFAFWRGPQEERRFSGPWLAAWIKASTPRIIVAAVFCTGLFFASYFSGGSSEAQDPEICAVGLPPLTAQPVTDERMTAGADGLRRLADAAQQSDLDQAQILLRSDAHNITHDIDAALRPADPELARELCSSIIAVENEMITDEPDIDTIVAESQRAAGLLDEARTVIATTSATPDPFTNPGAGGTVCDHPVGSITDDPVTEERVRSAVARLEATAAAAEERDLTSTMSFFFGDAHDISHDIDGPLRDIDIELAKRLCASVLELEIQLAGRYDFEVIREEAVRSAALLTEAAEALRLSE